jgi:hypothetical protein
VKSSWYGFPNLAEALLGPNVGLIPSYMVVGH